MAARYWVGGTATWDSTAGTKWSATSGGAGGQAVPTSADDVFFDAASGTSTVTVVTGGGTALSINCTGFTGTIAGSAAFNVYGNVTLVAGMGFTSTGTINLRGTGTFTTNGKTPSTVDVNATGITVTLGSALTLRTTTSSLKVSAGTLTTSASNFSITAGDITFPGSAVKTLSLNASTVSLAYTGAVGAFYYSGSNLTFNAGTSTINFTGSSGSTLDAASGLTFHNVAFTSTDPNWIRQIKGANTFNQLTISAPSSGINTVEFHANQTITTLVAAGASVIRRILFVSSAFGTARTLTVGTYATKQNIDFQDITAAGASAPWSGTSLGNCLGNSNITFTAAKTVYWNLTGSQNWTSTGWAATSGGAPALANFPLAQDTAIFDNAGAATTIVTGGSTSVCAINASSRTIAMTLIGQANASFYGNVTNGTGVTLDMDATIKFSARSTQTITSAGSSFRSITVLSASNTLTLGDAFISTGTITLNTGADFNAVTYSVTANIFNGSTSGSSINLGTASWTITGSGTCWDTQSSIVSGSAEIILSNNTTTARTFSAGTNTFGKLTIGGNTSISTTTISGTPTFSEIASTKTVAHTIVFPNVTTTVGAFSIRGTVGNVVTLSRTGASGTFTLAKSGAGVIDSDYLSISNSTATPTNTWYAGANSTNGGGNTNWIFTAAPPAAGGNFFSLF